VFEFFREQRCARERKRGGEWSTTVIFSSLRLVVTRLHSLLSRPPAFCHTYAHILERMELCSGATRVYHLQYIIMDGSSNVTCTFGLFLQTMATTLQVIVSILNQNSRKECYTRGVISAYFVLGKSESETTGERPSMMIECFAASRRMNLKWSELKD